MNIRLEIKNIIGEIDSNMVNNLIYIKTLEIYVDLIDTYLKMVDYKFNNKFINSRLSWLSVDTKNKTFAVNWEDVEWNDDDILAFEKIYNYMGSPTKAKTKNDSNVIYISYDTAITYVKSNKKLLLKKIAEIEKIYISKISNISSLESTKNNVKVVNATSPNLGINVDKEMLEMVNLLSNPKGFSDELETSSILNASKTKRNITYGFPAKNPLKNGVNVGLYSFYNDIVGTSVEEEELTLSTAQELKKCLDGLNADTQKVFLFLQSKRILTAGKANESDFKRNNANTFAVSMQEIAEFLGYKSPVKQVRERILMAINQLSQMYIFVPVSGVIKDLIDISSPKTDVIYSPIINVAMLEASNIKRSDMVVNDLDILPKKLYTSVVSIDAIENKLITGFQLSFGLPFEALLYKKWKYVSYIIPTTLVNKDSRFTLASNVGLYFASLFRVDKDLKNTVRTISFYTIAMATGINNSINEARQKQQTINRCCNQIRIALNEYVLANRVLSETLNEFDNYVQNLNPKNWNDKNYNFNIYLNLSKKNK